MTGPRGRRDDDVRSRQVRGGAHQLIADAWSPSARRSARFALRFAMIIRPIFWACRWRAASSIISPAPTGAPRGAEARERRGARAGCRRRRPSTRFAPIAGFAPHPLGDGENVVWKSRLRRVPAVPAFCAARYESLSCPRICGSPRISESSRRRRRRRHAARHRVLRYGRGIRRSRGCRPIPP